ncbi:MAG: ATP-binding protein [Clostridiales bacterium]|nr:ATP-binding protein [Clostridiales bacterium]MCD8134155.1 ATP-binding protein [Clostridiales bacterium]
MGYYLNSNKVYSLYKSEANKPYFVDKTEMLVELMTLVEQGNNHVCITRPRRFGKSVMATMVGAFFSKGFDSSSIFDSLKIAREKKYREHLNRHDVIYIDFSEAANISKSYDRFIEKIEKKLITDLCCAFPSLEFDEDDTVVEYLRTIHEETMTSFVFVFDEWDCIFHKKYTTDDDKESYINFLASLTKGTGYVSLSYMTGVLPVAKYSSGSTINNFIEYTMATDDKFSEYFGFTESEVDELYRRYETAVSERNVSREELKLWYDGYHTPLSERMYNPRSVVLALDRNRVRSYWTTTGPYSEISGYIVNDIDGVKRDVALMIAGESVPADVEEFAATAMHLSTRNEIFSAMVVYGFLNYEDGRVHVPNRELMNEFAKTIRREKKLGYIYDLANASSRMLRATLDGDTKTMEEILQFAHDTETPLLDYNNETELTAIVNLVYLAARDSYYVEREDKAGEGYVDFIFYPERQGDDGMIVELKVDDTPEAAIRQIKDRKYVLKFQGKMAEKKRHTGRILMIGIAYSRKSKDHHCRVEIF